MRTSSRRQFLFMTAGAGGLAALHAATGIQSASPSARVARHDSPATRAADLQTVKRTTQALGSEISITALLQRTDEADRAISAAFREIATIDEIMSLYRPESQIRRLNRDGELDRPHPYLLAVLRTGLAVSKRTGGAFDVTVQPLWQLYAAAKKTGELPGAAGIEQARRAVDWRNVEVDEECIRLKAPGAAVTLNGIAQGFAADCLLAVLRDHGIAHALVNTGEIGTVGRKPDGEAWTVGIQHPRRADAYVSLAKIAGRCMATSGDYATSFSSDNAAHHIFDPATGRSPGRFASVTVLAPTGIEADALSTAIFVMGVEKGLALAQSTPGVDVLFVMKNGRTLATSGFPLAS